MSMKMVFLGKVRFPEVLFFGSCVWLASGRSCSVSRDYGTDGSRESVVVDCKSLGLTQIPGDIPSDATQLLLQNNKMTRVLKNAFAAFRNLVFLDLSINKIRHLEFGCFNGLINLQRLHLFGIKVRSFPDDIFRDSPSLKELVITQVGFKSYHTAAVRHLKQLKVLAVSPPADMAVPAAYSQFTKLEVLDFRNGDLVTIRNDTLDAVRGLNISTVSFRDMDMKDQMLTIHSGAFSNFPSLRVLNLACNDDTPQTKIIAELSQIVNSSVDTVILDGLGMQIQSLNLLDSADFCKPFWRRVTRLSCRGEKLSGLLTKGECLQHLRDLNLAYNNLLFFNPPLNYAWLGETFPEMRSIDLSYREISTLGFRERYCYGNNLVPLMYRGEDYFIKRQRRDTASYAATNSTSYRRDVATKKKLVVTLPLYLESAKAVNILSMAMWSCSKDGPVVIFKTNRLLFFNISHNRFAKRIESHCLFVGLSLLRVLDMSYGAAESIDTELFKYYPNLRVLNASHNALGTSGNSLLGTFTYLTLLRELDISYNRLTDIACDAFSSCVYMERLKLNNNELDHINIELGNMSSLELLDLSGNRLSYLGASFTKQLDHLYTRRRFQVDIRRNAFTCDCSTISFVRWVQDTLVQLVGRHQVICSHDRREVVMSDFDLRHLVDKCHTSNGKVFSIVLPPVVAVVFLGVIVALALQNRWYLQYAFIVCRLKGRRQRTEEGIAYDAIVLYFMHATTTAEAAASRIVSRWIIEELRPRVEEDWGMRLHIGDRDDVAGPSKVDNFVRPFRSSNSVIVCVTRELVRDSHCTGCLHLALSSPKPLSKYLFVVFDDIDINQLSRRFRHLLASNSPARRLDWHNDDPRHFWRDMRRAMLRTSGLAMCGGNQKQTVSLPDSQMNATDA